MIADTDARISKEGDPNEYTKIVWKAGVLTEERLPAIVLNSMRQPIAVTTYGDLPYAEEEKGGIDFADGESETVVSVVNSNKEVEETFNTVDQALEYLKQKAEDILAIEAKRNITGNPIPDKEAQRGARVTSRTIRDEIFRWRSDPVLSKYALSEEEEKALLSLEPK